MQVKKKNGNSTLGNIHLIPNKIEITEDQMNKQALDTTVGSDCSHEIKRHLLLGRKAMTNIDRILKNREITLPTKVHIVKALFFPAVMYGCESWTMKKAEDQRIDAFELWCQRRLFRVPWTERKSNQLILKEISPNIHWKD